MANVGRRISIHSPATAAANICYQSSALSFLYIGAFRKQFIAPALSALHGLLIFMCVSPHIPPCNNSSKYFIFTASGKRLCVCSQRSACSPDALRPLISTCSSLHTYVECGRSARAHTLCALRLLIVISGWRCSLGAAVAASV